MFDRQGHVAKVCPVVAPLLLAALVGVSRVDDYWHHWQDVFAGGLIGNFLFHITTPNFMKMQNTDTSLHISGFSTVLKTSRCIK